MRSSNSSSLAQIRIRARWQLARLLLKVRPRKEARRFAVSVVKVDRLGDFVLAVSAIRLLTEKFGQENCLLVLSPFAQELACREFPDTPRLIMPPFVPKKLRRLVPLWQKQRKELSGLFCEHLVSMRHQPSLYRDAFLNWIPSRKRHGLTGRFPFCDFSGGSFPFDETILFPKSAPVGCCLELESHRQVLETVLQRPVTSDEIKPRLHSFKRHTGGNLLVAPFASERVKDYPTTSLIAALHHFQRQQSLPIDVIVAPDQASRLPEFEQLGKRSGVLFRSATVCPSLGEYFHAVACAEAVLTMDSASAHLAGALDKPTVTLLGGGHGQMFGPWWHKPDRQVWLRIEIACQNCNWQCTQPENSCLTRISPELIASSLLRMLA